MDAVQRLQALGQIDLGAAVEAMGAPLWSVQREIATAVSKHRARVAVPSCNAPLRVTEPVLTPSGWVALQRLRVGDLVAAQDGTWTPVTRLYAPARREVYRFHLDSGVTVDSAAAHRWAVDAYTREPGDGVVPTKRRVTLTTQEILDRYGGEGVKPNPLHRVSLPMAEPIQFPEQPVPVDPYQLGAILGDGHITARGGVSMTCRPEDRAIVEGWCHPRGHVNAWGAPGYGPALRALGLAGHRAWERFVPRVYLWNSPAIRLAVLQGLMDTDGGISGMGTEYSTTSSALAAHVRFLVQSLGGRCSVRERVPEYTYKGERRRGRVSYRLNITLPVCPFRLQRKARRWHEISRARRKTHAYTVQWVEYVGPDDTMCISVAHPSQLFVLDNFVVTHNSGKTFLAARLALAFFNTYTPGIPCAICEGPCRGCKVITTASKFEHLQHVFWTELRLSYAEMQRRGIPLPGRMGIGQSLILDDGPDHFIIGHSPKAAEGFQGYHAAHKLILGDEATSLDEEMQSGMVGLLASGDSRLMLIFNPTTPDTYAAMECRSPRTQVIKIDAWSTPHFTGEEVPAGANLITPDFLEELKSKGMGPGSLEWVTRVQADFWDTGEDALIALPWYDRSVGALASADGTRVLGIDLAPYGDSENVIAFRSGQALRSLTAFPAMRQDHFWQGPVTDAVRRVDPHYVIYDADGVGAGVIAYAEAAVRSASNCQLLPFRGGLKTMDRFTNARSAWWWSLRRRFENNAISLQVTDDKLRSQTTSMRYKINTSGDIRVETKSEMRKRGLDSPDRGDAVMYAFALLDELPVPVAQSATPVVDAYGFADRSLEAMQRRDIAAMRDRQRGEQGGAAEWDAWPWDD